MTEDSVVEAALTVDGIRLHATAAHISRPDRNDLVLIELSDGTSTAAVFTKNAFCAAPVQIAKRHLSNAPPRYLLINSGNANAGTGPAGIDAALACCTAVATEMQCTVDQVLPFSTGVIGQALPFERINSNIKALHQGLDAQAWQAASKAIMTTDTVNKLFSLEFDLDGQPVHLTGMAKGSGMIRPDMATMLSFIATDARIDAAQLQRCLHKAVAGSFNRITVDGDTSTNDAVVLMATGRSGVEINDLTLKAFQDKLNDLCETLAKSVVRDGEGATKLINVVVEEGNSDAESAKVAYAIAHSPLVKTAFFASDPNWGRILAAVGYAGVEQLDIDKVELFLDDVCLVQNGGVAATYTEEQGQRVMSNTEITVRVNLHRGKSNTTVWTCDFSYDYVKINAEYRT